MISAHGSADAEHCPGSGLPPAPPPPRHGWRTLIDTREDGPIQGPIHLGDPTDDQIAADVRWLRQGRLRDANWPDTTGASAPRIERLTAEAIAEEAAIDHHQRLAAGEIAKITE